MRKSQAGTFWLMGLTAVAVLGLLLAHIDGRHKERRAEILAATEAMP